MFNGRGSGPREPFGGNDAVWTGLAFGTAALFLLVPAALTPPRTFGDSGEYYLMAESLLAHGTPDLRPQDLAQLASSTTDEPIAGNFRTLSTYRQGRTGAMYALHFWAYPAVSLPVRVTLRLLHAHQYKAFAITNALLLTAAFWVVSTAAPYPLPWRLLAGSLLIVSPVGWFVTLPHPEVFTASMVAMSLAWWRAGSIPKATLAASLGSMQNPPVVLLAGLLWLAAALMRAPGRQRRLALASAALLPAAIPFLFNLWTLGSPSVIADENITLSGITLGRALELVYDLNIGLLPYAPLTVVLAAGATLAGLGLAAARGFVLATGTLFLVMALVCSGMNDWNHGTSGPSRYAVWLFPFVVFLLVEVLSRACRKGLALAGAGLALGVQVLVFVMHGAFRAPEDYLQHSWAARFVLCRWPALYAPTPEIFSERTAHTDGYREGPFVYQVAGRCLKALAQKRHADVLRERCGPEPAAFTRFRAAAAERAGGRSEWTYVDYR